MALVGHGDRPIARPRLILIKALGCVGSTWRPICLNRGAAPEAAPELEHVMGHIPSLMRYQEEARPVARKSRAPVFVLILIGMAVGLAIFMAALFLGWIN